MRVESKNPHTMMLYSCIIVHNWQEFKKWTCQLKWRCQLGQRVDLSIRGVTGSWLMNTLWILRVWIIVLIRTGTSTSQLEVYMYVLVPVFILRGNIKGIVVRNRNLRCCTRTLLYICWVARADHETILKPGLVLVSKWFQQVSTQGRSRGMRLRPKCEYLR